MIAASIFESFSGGIELNYVIHCVWCKKQNLTQLVQLGCFHLSCKVCLQSKLEDPSPRTAFNCPECDMSCMVPMGGVDEFPDEPLQHKMNQIAAIFSNEKPNCKVCKEVNVVSSTSSVCITCKVNLCEKDAKGHQGTPGHKVITHEELCVEPNLSLMLKSKVSICQEHSSEKNYFCKNCQLQICADCAMLNHLDHKKDSLINIAAEYRKILEENVGEIKKTERLTKENIQKLEETLAEIQENYRKVGENRKATLRKIDQEAKLLKNQVNFEITEEKNKIKQCKSAESYIKVFLKFSSDLDVIEKCKEILTNLENCEVIGEYKGACSLSDKMQGIGLNENVNESEERKRLSGLEEKVCKTEDIVRMRGSGLEKKVSKTKEIKNKRASGRELKVKWEDDFWTGLSAFEGELVVVRDRVIKWLTMDGESKCNIKCVDLGCAWNVEVCQGEVYVSDKEKRAVLVVDREGKMKRKVCLPECENGVDTPLGLAVDRMNKDIYVSSEKTNTIYKCVTGSQQFIPWIRNGWFKKVLNEPEYLCLSVDHHLVVSNSESHTVTKFNPQGQCVWSYGSKGSGTGQLSLPQGVCSDSLGHIYVADKLNDRIVVISKDGHHLMEVDIGEKIWLPQAVSFRNQRLVITTGSNHMYVI